MNVSSGYMIEIIIEFVCAPRRAGQVGPLWIRNSEAERGGGISVSPGSRRETCGETCGTTGTAASGGSLGAGGVCEWAGHVPAAEGESVERIEGRGVPLARGEEVPLARETNKKGLEEDVWAWLEPVRIDVNAAVQESTRMDNDIVTSIYHLR